MKKVKSSSKAVLLILNCVKPYHEPKSPLHATERFDIALKYIFCFSEKYPIVGILILHSSVPTVKGKRSTEKLPNVCAAMILKI